MDTCTKIAGPLQEEATYQRTMIAIQAKKQGKALFRIQQALAEIDRYNEAFPNGPHLFPLSLKRLDILIEITEFSKVPPSLMEFYKSELETRANTLINDPRIIPDSKDNEQLMLINLYSQSMLSIKKYKLINDYYQEKFGDILLSQIPVSTYGMFMNIWTMNMFAAEENNDWKTALKFAEMKLATPPGNVNPWPNGNAKRNQLKILQKAALYSKNAGNPEKEKIYTQKASVLEKEIKNSKDESSCTLCK